MFFAGTKRVILCTHTADCQSPEHTAPQGPGACWANQACRKLVTGVLFTPSKRTLSAHPRGLLGKAFANARREHSAHTPADSWARFVLTRCAFAYCRDAWSRPRRPATVESTEEGRPVLHATVRKAEVNAGATHFGGHWYWTANWLLFGVAWYWKRVVSEQRPRSNVPRAPRYHQ